MAKRKDDLKVERDIANAIKEQTQGLDSYVSAQRELSQLLLKIREQEETVSKLKQKQLDFTNGKIKLTEAEVKILNEKLALEEDSLAVIKGQTKELTKFKNLAKSVGNDLKEWAKTMGSQMLPTFSGIVDKAFEFDGAIRNVAANMGISGARFAQLNTQMANAAIYSEQFGINQADLVNAAGAYSEELGRQVILSTEAAKNMSMVAGATGMAIGEVAQLAGEMEAFGLGATQSSETILSIRDMSEKMGINSGKVIKKFQQNLNLVNKLSFKNGVKGMAGMAMQSEKYKLSMEAVAGFAEQVFRPEGAIEAAANLQVLGGSLAQMGDPFQLMYNARYAPEELAKSISSAAAQSAIWNEELGEFEVGAMELDRLREASQATGISMEELVKTAKQTAKMDLFGKSLSGISGVGDAMEEYITGIAEIKDGKAQISLGIDSSGKQMYKELSKLSGQDLKILEKQKEDVLKREELAKQAMTLQDEWKALQNQLLVIASQFLLPILNYLRPMLEGLGTWLTELGPIAKSFLGGGLVALALGGKAAMWYLRGVWLGRGFNKRAKMGAGGGMSDMVKSKSGKSYAADSPQGKMIKNMGGKKSGGSNAMGKQVGSMKGSMAGAAKTAIQMIAFAAAIYILAEAFAVFSSDVSWDGVGRGVVAILAFTGAMYILKPVLKGMEKSWGGIAAMTALAGSMVLLGLSAMMFAAGGTAGIVGMAIGLGMLTAAVLALGLLGTAGIGWVGVAMVAALGLAMLALGYAVKLAAEGFSMVVDSFTNMFSVINSDNIGALLMLGPALMMTSLGIMALAASLVMLGVAFLAGGFLGLIALSETAETLKTAFGGMDSGNMVKAVDAINSVDMNKIEALKELSAMMTMMGVFGSKPLQIVMTIDGDIDIKGEGGGKKSTDWVNDPIFVSKLKDLIWEETSKGRTGGRA